MTLSDVIPYASIILSLLTFAGYMYWSHRSAGVSYTQSLEGRVAKLESDLTAATKRITELEDENLKLMRRLLAAGG